MSTVRRRCRREPHSTIGYPSYLDLLTAIDLAALLDRQGGQCPIARRGFFIPPEEDLPPQHTDLLNGLERLLARPPDLDTWSIEPTDKPRRKYSEELLYYLPWPVRIDLSQNFQMGNLMLVCRFLVDAYYRLGGMAGLRELLAELPTEAKLKLLAGAADDAQRQQP